MKRILYIDDDIQEPADTDPFLSKLRNKFDVFLAANADTAWECLELEGFDLIILDIMLPSERVPHLSYIPSYKKGIFILEALRSKTFPKNEITPVVVVSAISDQSDMSEIKQNLIKPDEYIEKPIYPNELLGAVERIFSGRL